MTAFDYLARGIEVRKEIPAAHRAFWQRLARPGTWFDGKTRVGIAAETRNAPACALCAERKAALSPYAVDGTHDSPGDLPDSMVDVVHRIVTDPARLQRQWYDKVLAGGLSETEYVEIVSIVCSTVSVDTFARAAGVPIANLPEPQSGEPARYRPPGAKPGQAWVPWILPEDASAAEADLHANGAANIRKALMVVPDEQRSFFDLVHAQYLNGPQILDVGNDYRASTRPQIELIAGRGSALNQCVY